MQVSDPRSLGLQVNGSPDSPSAQERLRRAGRKVQRWGEMTEIREGLSEGHGGITYSNSASLRVEAGT